MVAFPTEFPFVRRPAASAARPAAAPAVQPVQVAKAPEPAPHPQVTPAAQQTTAPEAPPKLVPADEPQPIVPVIPAPPASSTARLIERRKVRRDPIVTQALVRMDGFHGPPLKVALQDISIAGARLRSPVPLELENKGQIRLEVGPVRWTTRLRIVHCTRDPDGASTVGCAFLRTELLKPWPLTAA